MSTRAESIDWPRFDRIGEYLIKKYGHVHKFPFRCGNTFRSIRPYETLRLGLDLLVPGLEVEFWSGLTIKWNEYGNVMGGYQLL